MEARDSSNNGLPCGLNVERALNNDATSVYRYRALSLGTCNGTRQSYESALRAIRGGGYEWSAKAIEAYVNKLEDLTCQK
jgi:hypothetical protein